MCSSLLSILCIQQALLRCLFNEALLFVQSKIPMNYWRGSHSIQWTKTTEVFPPTQTLISWLFGHSYRTRSVGVSLVAQLVKNPPAMWEAWVWLLGWEDSLERGKAAHSSFLAWRIPWASPWGHKESDTTEQLSLSLFWISISLSI